MLATFSPSVPPTVLAGLTTKQAESAGAIKVPAAVAVGLGLITMLTLALVAMRAMVAPNGAAPLCAEVPLLLMFSLLMILEAMLFWYAIF
jgi:hypothetical protein